MTVADFWDIFEGALTQNVLKSPALYWLQPNQTAEEYARGTRIKMQATAEAGTLKCCNLDTLTFKHVAKQLGIAKFSQSRLYEAYVAMGGK